MKKNFLFVIIFQLCLYPTANIWAKNTQDLEHTLENVVQLQVVQSQEEGIKLQPEQVEKVYPMFVNTDENGVKSVDYEKLTPVLLLSIKELNQKVTRLEKFHQQESAANGNWGWKYFLQIGFVVIVFSSIFLSKKRKEVDVREP